MSPSVEDLEDQSRYRQILTISYDDLVPFIMTYLGRVTSIMILFWSLCTIFLAGALRIRFMIAGYYPLADIMTHTALGMIVFPLLSIPVHELLHIVPYYLSGARDIRIGMDLRQYLFYVTAHRYVATPLQFRIVAIIPFLVISISAIWLVVILPGLWKWSFSLFVFIHSTMCAGDFSLLNFYHSRKGRKIFTWDDANSKIAYFYEEI